MTLALPRNELAGDGTQTVFTFTFSILFTTDVVAYVGDTELVNGTDFTVIRSDDSGGTVTFATAPANGASIVLTRSTTLERNIEYSQSGEMISSQFNLDLDRLTNVTQELSLNAARTFSVDPSVTSVSGTTIPAPQANQLLGWSDNAPFILTNVTRIDAGGVLPATTIRSGITRYSTDDEAIAGTVTDAAITPHALASALAGISTKESFIVNVTNNVANVTAGTGKYSFAMPYPFAITEIKANLVTAQATGSLLTIDVLANGTSIFSTLLTIENTETTSVTATVPAVIATTTLATEDVISFDVPVIGDGTAIGLKVEIIGHQ